MRRTLLTIAVALGTAPLSVGQPASYRITTAAGVGIVLGDGGPAAAAHLNLPVGVALDAAGNLYIGDTGAHRVRKLTPAGIITTVAGTGVPGYNGDGQPATQAQLNGPKVVAVDSAGNLYVAEQEGHRVRRVTPAGIISTVAGTGVRGYNGDNRPASQAQLARPNGVAIDASGNLYVADLSNHRVRKVTPAGIITSVAGTGASGYNGDNQPAIQAQLNSPVMLALDGGGNLYILTRGDARVRRVNAQGVISTVAGTGVAGYNGDNRPATEAQLSFEFDLGSVALDSAGNLYIGEDSRIRKVATTGIITTVAGGGGDWLLPGGSGAASAVGLIPVGGVAVDTGGTLYFTQAFLNHVGTLASDGMVRSVAGANRRAGDGGPATAASLLSPSDVALDTEGNLFIADFWNFAVRKLSPSGVIETVSGWPAASGWPAVLGLLPPSIAADAAGNLYAADVLTQTVLRRELSGRVTTFAGGGGSVPGDGGPATAARLTLSDDGACLAVDSAGNLYISEKNGQRVRMVTPGGIISTVAGTGESGFSGNGVPAAGARLGGPAGLAIGPAGNLYFVEESHRRVSMVTTGGILNTIAGNAGVTSFGGDGGRATAAGMNPTAVAVDRAGNLYITGNDRVRKVAPDGIIDTIAGTGTPGFSGDGGPAAEAQLSAPNGLAVDGAGNVYIADPGNHRICKLTPPPAPSIAAGGVKNAASFEAGRTAPSSWASLFGSNLANKLVAAETTPLPAFLDGARVWVTDSAGTARQAMLHFVAPGQVNFLLPGGTRTGSATVQVTTAGGSGSASLQVDAVAPGLFSANSDGAGVAAALAQRYTGSGPQSPQLVFEYSATARRQVAVPIDLGAASDQVILLLYGTGIRGFSSAVTATVGGQAAEVLGAVAQGQYAGLDQVNVRVPRALAGRGEVQIALTVDGKPANMVTVNIR